MTMIATTQAATAAPQLATAPSMFAAFQAVRAAAAPQHNGADPVAVRKVVAAILLPAILMKTPKKVRQVFDEMLVRQPDLAKHYPAKRSNAIGTILGQGIGGKGSGMGLHKAHGYIQACQSNAVLLGEWMLANDPQQLNEIVASFNGSEAVTQLISELPLP